MVRETWGTRVGFILAAVGSAVGLGNIWRFPFLTGESGGAAFLFVYLAFVAFIGLPVLMVEFVIGRRSNRNVIGAFKELDNPNWQFAGFVGALAGFIILSYYSVVGGWVIQYFVSSFTGAYAGDAAAYFGQAATGTNAIVAHAIFMGLVAGIVAFGIRDGLERAAKLMVPSIIALLIILAGYGATLSGSSEAYAYYLSPNLDAILSNLGTIAPAAAGQAFFTLSLGMGVMVTYASYIDEDRSLLQDAGTIVVVDTGIAFLAGLVVFPFLFTQGVDPGSGGAGAVFISLAAAFSSLPAGGIIGAIFFFTLGIAALTSAFSILEVVVSYVIDTFDVERRNATLVLAAIIFVVGIPTAIDLTWLDVYDLFANNILLILGGLLMSLFIGWVYAEEGVDELTKGGPSKAIATGWLWVVRVVIPVVLAYTLYLGATEYWAFLMETF
ncbi:MAG: sodium-dependent transporter [Halobacteriota archaeon]